MLLVKQSKQSIQELYKTLETFIILKYKNILLTIPQIYIFYFVFIYKYTSSTASSLSLPKSLCPPNWFLS